MKKLLLLVLLCLISTNVFAEQVRVVETETGIAVVRFNEDKETAWKKNDLYGKPYVDIDESTLPNKDRKYWKLDGSKVVIDEQKKKDDVYSRLDWKYISGAMYQVFKAKMVILAPYIGGLKELVEYPNLPGVRDYGYGLKDAGIFTEEDLVNFKAIFMNLDIDLDNLPAGA